MKAIIFDFYGVFCADVTMRWFEKNVPNHDELAADFASICTQSDLGQLTKQAFFEAFHDLVGIPTQVIMDGVKAEIVMNHDIIDLARSLKGRYKLGLMSNATEEWLGELLRENNMYDIFDSVVVSANIGIAKPDKGIYEHTLLQLGAEPAETLFIDDRQVNVDAGNAYGIKSILYTDYESLVAQLAHEAIL